MVNQKSLTRVVLVAPAAAITTNTDHTAVDVGAGYANVGGREMRAILSAVMTANTTSVTVKLQDNTTSDTTGFADITGAAFAALTTTASAADIFFQTNKRYVRAVTTVAGTTPSVQPIASVFLAGRSN